MRAWVRLLIGAVLAMGAAVTAPAPVACACSCKGFSTAEALDAASAVFGGEVISTIEPTSLGSGDPVHYRIRVDRIYKGDLPEQVTVSSAASQASCGVRLAGKVTVFAAGTVNTLETGLCAAPVKLDVTVLGAGVRPTAVPPATPSETTPTARAPEQTPTPAVAPDRLLLGLTTLAVVLAVGAATVLLVRRPRP